MREIPPPSGRMIAAPPPWPAGADAAGPLLKVSGITKRFRVRNAGGPAGTIVAVDDVSFEIKRGECLGLVGESGCGKTTLSKVIMRALTPDSGKILFNDHGKSVDVLDLKGEALTQFRRHIQFIFQDPFGSLNPRMTVYDILSEPLVIHGIGTSAERKEVVKELMSLVGLNAQFLKRYPHSFSGGQRQRIGIARALALKPDLLLCDEPVSALDVSIQAQVLNLLKDLQAKLGLTYLFVSHNLAVVDYIADRIMVMCAGRIVEVAPSGVLFTQPLAPLYQGAADRRAGAQSRLPPRLRQADGRQGLPAGRLAGALHRERDRAPGADRCRRRAFRARRQGAARGMRGAGRRMKRVLAFAGLAPSAGRRQRRRRGAGLSGGARSSRARSRKASCPPSPSACPTIPRWPSFQWPGQVPGNYGGELTMLMSSAKDTRYLVTYGYAQLVVYDAQYKLVPNILESFEVEDGRIFTFHLRKGQKWSDGSPFTTEDFRFFWEDIANNPELSPAGPPADLVHDGEPAKVEVIDKTTIRYSWSKPNANFLPALALRPDLFIYSPSKYLKKLHKKYADPDELAARVKKAGSRSWAQLFNRMNNPYKNDNPKMPTLGPWVLKTKPPADRFVFERNPYYFRVDPQGHQLPYIDKVVFFVADGKLIPAKAGAGESMLQAKDIRFADYTFLKEGEKNGGYRVLLWKTGNGSSFTLFPDLTTSDPVWRKLLRDVRFRRALSLAINRHEINQVIYYGLAREGANTVLPESPLYKPRVSGRPMPPSTWRRPTSCSTRSA